MIMTPNTISAEVVQGNLFFTVPDTTLAAIVDESTKICLRFPEILKKIKNDQDRIGLQDKQLRLEQKQWIEKQTPVFSNFDYPESCPVAAHLDQGRPRMKPEIVLTFLIINEYFQSIYSKEAVERLMDSMTIYSFLAQHNVKMPGHRTIGDNVNAISADTRRFIMECQLAVIQEEQLDDFSTLVGDSTAVAADTRWPTDSGLIHRLLGRAFRTGRKLESFGLENVRIHWMNQWLPRLKSQDFKINNAKRKRTRNKEYHKLLEIANKAIWHLADEAKRLYPKKLSAPVSPMMRYRLNKNWDQFIGDLCDACRVYEHCRVRIKSGKTPPAAERVFSLSDCSAAYISKGDREPVIGYRPQLARSGKGFISALLIPEGNRPDSKMLVPLVEEAEALTGVLPSIANFDDGYSSRPEYNILKAKGIELVSFSGSKGKKIIGDDLWEQDAYCDARRMRSAVESLMFCLKYGHGFGQLRRRGIEAVRQSLIGKAIVYNLLRMILIRKEKAQEKTTVAAAA